MSCPGCGATLDEACAAPEPFTGECPRLNEDLCECEDCGFEYEYDRQFMAHRLRGCPGPQPPYMVLIQEQP